jgi:hypothetical protein
MKIEYFFLIYNKYKKNDKLNIDEKIIKILKIYLFYNYFLLNKQL